MRDLAREKLVHYCDQGMSMRNLVALQEARYLGINTVHAMIHFIALAKGVAKC